MVMPAFPWKSANRIDKVPRAPPDLGEELALARLDAMCKDIGRVYEPGADVYIASDGVVFNDLFGITDDDAWKYSVALMKMAADRGFHSIKIIRVMDFLSLTEDQTMTRKLYMSTVDEARCQLDLQFGDTGLEEVRKMIKEDKDTNLTYCGFVIFLTTDLRHSPMMANTKGSKRAMNRVVKDVAMAMMIRAESFTKIILAKLGDHIRLSVHPSSGAVKLSIRLVPQAGTDSWPRTPWQCSIAVGVDGGYKTVHAKDVRDTHKLIFGDGRPYFFREKSPLYDWEEDIVESEHLYPRGLIAHANGNKPRLDGTGLARLRELACIQGRVEVRGFSGIEDGVIGTA